MRIALILLFATCVSLVPAAQNTAKPRKDTEAKPSVTTLTGIVDQKGRDFVLTGEEAMRPVAVLRASGFSADNFARFVGMRVEVRGEISTEGDRRILTVKSLDDLKSLGPSGSQK